MDGVDRHGPDERLVALATGLTHVMYVLEVDHRTTVQYISESAGAFVGYSAEELVSQPELAVSLVHPDDLDAVTATIEAARPGDVAQFTMRVSTRDGRTIWTHHRCCKEVQPDGSIVVYGAARDETENVARSRELAAREQRLRLILENVSDVVFEATPEDRLAWVSASVREVFGWEPAELLGLPTDELIHPDDRSELSVLREQARAGTVKVARFRVRAADGSYRWMSGISRLMRDSSGAVLGRVVGLHDVDEIVRAEAALAESERYFRVLAEYSGDLVFRSTVDGLMEWVSPSVRDILGYEPEQLISNIPAQLLHPDDLPKVDAVRRRTPQDEPVRYEARLRRADGTYRWMSILIRPVTDDAGRLIGRVGNARDVQDEVEARNRLIESERRSREAIDSAPIGMAVADLSRQFQRVNAALCRMLDRDEAWLLAHGMPDVLAESFDEVDLRMRDAVRRGEAITARGENLMLRADGSPLWVEHSVALLRDDAGHPQSYVCQFLDITEARAGREQLSYLATHDSLTGLLTRTGLLQGLERVQSHPPRSGGRLAAAYIDIDNLKEINDDLGHAAGDAILVEVAGRIRASARADDLVARLGGDEIVVVLPDVHTEHDAIAVADKLMSALERSVEVQGQLLRATVSIGVAVAEPAEAAEALIARADSAMYRAKRNGRNRVASYDPELDAEGGGHEPSPQ